MADIFGLPTHLVSHRLIHEPEEFYILQLDIFLSPTAVQVSLANLFSESPTGHLARQPTFSNTFHFFTCTINTRYSNSKQKAIETCVAPQEAPQLNLWHDINTHSNFILRVCHSITRHPHFAFSLR